MLKELILNSRKKSIIDGVIATELPIIIKCKDETKANQLVTYISEIYGLPYFDLAMTKRFGNSELLNNMVDSKCVIDDKSLAEIDPSLLGDHVQLHAYTISDSDEFHLHVKLIERPLIKLNLIDSFPHRIVNGEINGNYDIRINNSKDYLNLRVHNNETIDIMRKMHESRLTEAYFQDIKHYSEFNAKPLLITLDPVGMKQKNIIRNIRDVFKEQMITGIHFVIESSEKLSFDVESELANIIVEVQNKNNAVGGKHNDSI